MAQIFLPVSDHDTGEWATTPLWSKIDDDSSVNPTGDDNQIASDAVGNNANTSNADFKLTTGAEPSPGVQELRVRWYQDDASRSLQAHIELWQGAPGSGTMVAEIVSATDVGPTEVGATTQTIDTITDYEDLYIRLWGRGTSGGPSRSMVVELAEFVTQDVASPGDDLTPDDATHAHTADQVTLTQKHSLAVDDASHGHTADQPTVQPAGTELVVDPATHAHTVDQATLTQGHSLAPEAATHAHTADQATLTQAHQLAPADATHAHTADEPTVTPSGGGGAIQLIEEQSGWSNDSGGDPGPALSPISFTLGGSVEVDDIVLLIQSDNWYTVGNLLTPTGTAVTTWVEKTDNGLPVDGGTNDNHAKVWVGTVTTAGGTVIANRTQNDDEGHAQILVFRNAEFDTADATETDAFETAHVAPSVTPTSGKTDDYLVCVWGTQGTIGNYTVPGSMTALSEWDTPFNTYRAAYEQLASDSATGTRTATLSTSGQWFAVSVLMKSTGVGGASLTSDATTHSHSADAPTLTQKHSITVNDATHGHTAEQATVTPAGADLDPDDASHGHTADAPTLTQKHALSVDSAAHAHTADQPTLTQAHQLAAADALHGHTADQPTLTQAHQLAPADALHGHAADQPTLTQAHVLTPADALHGHTADQSTLTVAGVLAVDSASHGHTADQVTLTQSHSLSVDSATHAHTADAVAVTQTHPLTVDDALHGHAAEQATVMTEAGALAVGGATHAHTADVVLLTQAHALTVDSTSHGHAADGPTLVLPTLVLPTYSFFPPVVDEHLDSKNSFTRRIHVLRGTSVIRNAAGEFVPARAPLPKREWVEGRDYFIGGHRYSRIPEEVGLELIGAGYEPELE